MKSRASYAYYFPGHLVHSSRIHRSVALSADAFTDGGKQAREARDSAGFSHASMEKKYHVMFTAQELGLGYQ